jgi:hypothetical protein
MNTIALLTDFGLDDSYVGQVKGVLAAAAPDARVVDLSHGVPPFDVVRAGFFLEASRPYFPQGTVFACVVDPGVGGARDVVCLEKFGQAFLAPDNGLLSLTLAAPGGPAKAARVEPRRIISGPVSNTFHGRDIFAPAAALLVKNLSPGDLGPLVEPDSLERLPWAEPRIIKEPERSVEASVLHTDRFGNLILNVSLTATPDPFAGWDGVRLVRPVDRTVELVKSYADLAEGELGLIPGSQGFMELSMNQRSAADELSQNAGDTICFTPRGGAS